MTTRRAALFALITLVLPACGNLARDVIMERDELEASVPVEAGRLDTAVADAASSPAPSATAPGCSKEDGGCPVVVHCDFHECSRACPFGCPSSINGGSDGEHAKSHKHLPPREATP